MLDLDAITSALLVPQMLHIEVNAQICKRVPHGDVLRYSLIVFPLKYGLSNLFMLLFSLGLMISL